MVNGPQRRGHYDVKRCLSRPTRAKSVENKFSHISRRMYLSTSLPCSLKLIEYVASGALLGLQTLQSNSLYDTLHAVSNLPKGDPNAELFTRVRM